MPRASTCVRARPARRAAAAAAVAAVGDARAATSRARRQRPLTASMTTRARHRRPRRPASADDARDSVRAAVSHARRGGRSESDGTRRHATACDGMRRHATARDGTRRTAGRPGNVVIARPESKRTRRAGRGGGGRGDATSTTTGTTTRTTRTTTRKKRDLRPPPTPDDRRHCPHARVPSTTGFRSQVLGVMSPARFPLRHCACGVGRETSAPRDHWRIPTARPGRCEVCARARACVRAWRRRSRRRFES